MSPLELALGAVGLALASAVAALATASYPRLMARVVFPLLGLAGLSAAVAGGAALVSGSIEAAQLPLGLPFLPWRVRFDGLAGFMFALIGVVVAAVSVYGPGYVREFEGGRDPLPALGGFTGLFVAGMLAVVLADDAFLFMIAWEVMSLSSYFLVAFQHESGATRRAAFIYLLMAHVSGLAILLSYGVLANFGGGFDFASMRGADLPATWATVAFLLAFLGFGMKAGLVPLHAWLPEAHPVAPSHISALMSGVMLKVAVYGFIRVTFDLIGQVQTGWGVLVLMVGAVSALLGVLYALMQHDLKQLLAYSSVENLGIVFVGLGLSLIFLGTGHTALGVLGLAAALYHSFGHALFKSLLFLGAGAVLHATHERDLEHMGGLLRRMPWTGLFFLLGCISISGLPPLNGFVSEWLTFQTALQAWSLESGMLRTLIPVAAAMLALTGALAAACFVRAYGVSFLGRARTRHVRHSREVPAGMRIAQGALALGCLLLGVLPTGFLDLIGAVPRQLLGQGLGQVTANGWLWLTPVAAETASYAAPLVVLSIGFTWWVAMVVLRRLGGPVRRCPPWDCGFSTPDARMQYTATAFAQPVRRVFGLLMQVEEGVERADGAVRYRLRVGDRLWGLFYEPIGRMVLAAARRVGFLQSGNVRNYLGWSLGTLLVLLWVIS